MKTAVSILSRFGLFAAILFVSSLSLATTSFRSRCMDSIDTDHELTIWVVDNELKQVRLHTLGSYDRVIPFMKLAQQTIEGYTLYSIQPASGLLQVENKVLLGQNGYVSLDGSGFYCMED